jgi:DNA repair exonuclease SbcCD ATPase subunit
MINETLLSTIATLITIVSSFSALAYWLGKKFSEIDNRFMVIDEKFNQVDKRFNQIDKRFESLETRFNEINKRLDVLANQIDRLESAFLQFSEILVSTLETKNILSTTEALALRGVIRSLLPSPKSKYYTKEVYERLLQLLDKDPNEYTMADIEEMERIADLIEKEGYESNRRDLKQYAWKLRYYAMIAKVVFIYPKLRKAGIRSTP